MGKVTVSKKSPTKAVSLSQEVLTKVNSLRSDGSAQFLKKEFAKAAEYYDQAVKLLPDGATEKAELLQKKVGCLLQLKKYKEAVKDATTVLEIQPGAAAALKARAKAYEQLGFLTKALADIQAVNKTDASTAETKETETRLKDAVSGRNRPTSAPAGKAATRSADQTFQFTFKATLGSESKFVYAHFNISYPELLEQIREKFPNAGPVALKYVDKEGDQVTISSRQDIQAAMSDVVMAFQRHMASMQGKIAMPPHLPPIKIMVVPVLSEADVPRAPAAELAERLNGQGIPDAAAPPPYEPEEYILNFIRLMADTTGLDPHIHHEHLNLGQDKVVRAIQETVQSEEFDPLLDEAADHYRDAVVASLLQWGNVALNRAERQLQKLQARVSPSSPEWDSSEELKKALAFFKETELKVQEALKYNPDSPEAFATLAQIEFEVAKAKLGHVLPLAPAEETAGKTQEEITAQQNKQLAEVCAKLSKDKVLQAQAAVDKASEYHEKAFKLAEEQYKARVARDHQRAVKDAAKAGLPAPEEPKTDTLIFQTPPSYQIVMHGNMLYDWSNVLALTGAAEWRPVLDKAADMFKSSGAPASEVRVALKNHTRAAELDLGPDPEPAAPTTPAKEPAAAAAPAVEKKEAKGLPSLEVKKKPAADKK